MCMRNSNGPKTEPCGTPDILRRRIVHLQQHVDIFCSGSYIAKLKE